MANKGKSVVKGSKKIPKSLAIAEAGVNSGRSFAAMMSALMSDILSGRVTPATGNATCNAGGKLLKVVEMQYKYGTAAGNGQQVLTLVHGDADR